MQPIVGMATNKDFNNKHFWKITKIASCILCLAGFTLNSLAIFQNLIENKTLTSNELQKHDKLLLPAITICSISGYKEKMDEYSDLDLKNYKDKTADLEEFLYQTYICDQNYECRYFTVNEMNKDGALWKISTVYSKYKGRCHTIQYKEQVKKITMLF